MAICLFLILLSNTTGCIIFKVPIMAAIKINTKQIKTKAITTGKKNSQPNKQ